MSILSSLIEPATKLLDKVIEDKDQKNALAHEIATMAERHAQELAKGQLDVNKVEAAHKSLFVAGWRPAIGWVCALGLFYNVILANIIGIWVDVPEIDTTLLVPVMMGMLGLGAMRSYEKVQGVSREK
jgi:roadblock/LC7 domain-containing protein|tara:strand:+ start:508 stop:891 length:384 start_codon:yes stop_codon:yes gene_type:complete